MNIEQRIRQRTQNYWDNKGKLNFFDEKLSKIIQRTKMTINDQKDQNDQK